MTHTYTYLQTVKTDYGNKVRLRRDDGKLVCASRKRVNELSDQGRLKLESKHDFKGPSETKQTKLEARRQRLIQDEQRVRDGALTIEHKRAELAVIALKWEQLQTEIANSN